MNVEYSEDKKILVRATGVDGFFEIPDTVCVYRRCFDFALFKSARRNFGFKTVQFYWRRIEPCCVWSHGDCSGS